MDKLTELTKEYNIYVKWKEDTKVAIKIDERNIKERNAIIKHCDREMDKLKKKISEESKE